MGYRDLNNRGLHAMRMQQFMQEGGQPQMAPQAKSPMDDLIPAIKAALEQGASLPELIVRLAQGQVPIDAIQEALMAAGIDQQEIMQAFQMIEQQQAQAQVQTDQMEGPVEPTAQPQEGVPVQEMAPGQAQMPMAQGGAELRDLMPTESDGPKSPFYSRDKIVGVFGEMVGQGYTPDEAQKNLYNAGVISEQDYEFVQQVKQDFVRGLGSKKRKLQEGGEEIKSSGGYDYKKVTDPETGEATYFTKKTKGSGNWKDLQSEGNNRALKAVRADIFGDNVEEWQGTPEEADWDAQMGQMYREDQAKKRQAAALQAAEESGNKYPTLDEILSGGYNTRIINYGMGDDLMLPGHIEAVLTDPQGNAVPYYRDKDGRVREAVVNRWTGNDSNNARSSRFRGNFSREDLENYILNKGKNRSVFDREMTPAELEQFLTVSAGEDGRPYSLVDDNCADGVCRAYGLDPDNVGSTALVGFATEPDMVYKTLYNQGKALPNSLIGRKPGTTSRSQELRNMLAPGMGQLYNQYIKGNDYIPDFLEPAIPVTGTLLGNKLITAGSNIYNTARDVRDGAKELNRMYEEDFQPGMVLDDPVGAAKSVYNYWFKEHGGSTGKYSNALDAVNYNNIFKQGGSFDNPGLRALRASGPKGMEAYNKITGRAQYGGEGNMAQIQQGPQGTPSPEELMAIIQKQQMQMQQMQMQMQQMMQTQQAEEEVGQAEIGMNPTYRTDSIQKKSGGTVELDTETIANIMAAGGSVKFS